MPISWATWLLAILDKLSYQLVLKILNKRKKKKEEEEGSHKWVESSWKYPPPSPKHYIWYVTNGMSNDIENNSVFLLLYHSPFYYKTINNLVVDYQVTNLQELPLKEIQKPKSKIDLCIEYTCHLLWINYLVN